MKKIKLAINGFGRIGRLILRSAIMNQKLQVVAINDLIEDINYIAYLFKYDSIHGKISNFTIKTEDNYLLINNNKIFISCEKNIENLNWHAMDIDIVVDATGVFLDKKSLYKHIISGAKKVILTAPPNDDIPIFVCGVNTYKNIGLDHDIISNASCTTNCLAPLAKILDDNFSIEEGFMSTIHSVTSNQYTVDSINNKNWRSGRNSLLNIIPTTTGVAKALEKVLPNLKSKIIATSFRVPTCDVSVIDFNVKLLHDTSLKEIISIIENNSKESMKGIIEVEYNKLVSQDFLGETTSCILDANSSLMLNSKFFKLIAWYDNEYAYASRVIDLIFFI